MICSMEQLHFLYGNFMATEDHLNEAKIVYTYRQNMLEKIGYSSQVKMNFSICLNGRSCSCKCMQSSAHYSDWFSNCVCYKIFRN